MKEALKKLITIFVLMMMLINSSFLLIISTAVDAIEQIIDETKINVLQEIELEKYVNYSTESVQGVLTQFNLKTGIEYVDGEEYAPLGSTGILLNLPKIENEFPENVEVIGKSTKATNGSDSAKDFRFVYDKDTGELKLAVVNQEDDDGNIYSENIDGAKDEYTIICYYSANCYNDSNLERNLEISGFVQANIENEIGTRKRADVNGNYQVTENISGLISTNIQTTDIYNGYIESNNKNNTKYVTEYVENLEIDVSMKELSDEVNITTDNNFVNKNNELNDKDKLIYKTTKIDKNKVMDLLGEDGYLQILNHSGDILGELNKDTEVGENGIYEVIYQDDLNDIVIKTSKIQKVGTIVLQNTKHIKENMTNLENTRIYSKNNISCLNNVQEMNEETGEVIKEEQKEIYSYSNDNVIEIKEAESRIDLSIDKSEWTNNIQNDVILKANFVINDSRYSLFNNPVLEIKLPNEVASVTLGDISLLYANSLKISNAEVIENDDAKVIRVTLRGQQNEYILDSIINGSELLIPATIILKKDIQSVDTNIIYAYVNNESISENKELKVNIKSNTQNVEEQENVENDINVVANNEFITEIVAKVGNHILTENDVVYEDESIVFTVKLINDSNQTVNNPKVVYNIPEGAVLVTRNGYLSDIPIPGEEGFEKNPLYTKQLEESEVVVQVESLAPGEIYEESYRVLVETLSDDLTEKIIENEFKTFIEDSEINSRKINYIAKEADLSVNLYPYEKEYISNERNYFSYYLDVTNLTDRNLKDVKVEVVLGKELDLESQVGRYDEINYDENTGILLLTFDSLSADTVESIKISAYANKFEDNKHEYDVKFYSYVYCEEDKKYRSDLEEIKIETAYVSIVQTSEKEGLELQADEEIEYNFLVKNEGNLDTIIDVTDNLPEGLLPITAEYECYEIKEDNSGFEKVTKVEDISAENIIDNVVMPDFQLRTYIPSKESINIKIKAKVDIVFEDMEIVNFATVTGDEIFARTSNAIKNTILSYGYTEEPEQPDDPEIPSAPEQPEKPDNPDNPEIPENQKYSISGVVWVDENKDGKRSDNEELLQGITVKLFDMETNKIVVDENNNSKILETDKNGYYNFNQLKVGKYIVLFEFDTNIYGLTTYQKNAISENANSDVILKEVNVDGNIYKAGATNIIELYKDYSNIDMGLVENTQFDLKLDKYVSKITVTYNNKEKVYEYNNSKLAKVDIPTKQVSDTLVTIEYKIVVTNEGNISGYVESIIDYLPQEMTFNSSNNADWKKDSSNNLINDSLANKKINPGESEEVTLILNVKNVTKTITNIAEIGLSNNVNQIEDVDSVVKNRNENEDDYSKAEVIISIKTGIIISILKILGIISLLVMIAFIIYNLKNKKIKILNIMPIIILGIFVIPVISSITYAYDESYGPDYAIATYSDLKYHMNGGNWEVVNSGGRFWCASPGFHLCNDGHKYLKQNVRWEYFAADKEKIYLQLGGCQDYSLWDFSVTGNPPQNFTLTKNASPSSFKYYNSNHIVLGPFNFSTSLAGSYISSWNVVDQNGNNVTGSSWICNSNGSSKGLNFSDTFYIAVPESVTNITLSVQAEYKYDLTEHGIGITTYKLDTSDSSYCTNSGAQHLRTIDTVTRKKQGSTTATVSWNVTLPKGYINITKKDFDTGNGLSGATFRITGLNDSRITNYSKVVTMSSGNQTYNVLYGNYKVEEIGTPNGYKLSLQIQKDLTTYPTVNIGQTTYITFRNRLYGNLIVEKVDTDKNQVGLGTPSELEDLTFKGTQFKIYYTTLTDNTPRYIYNFVDRRNEDKPSTFNTTTNKANAQIFEVGWDEAIRRCRFELGNLPAYYKYYVEEIKLTDDMLQYYDIVNSPVIVGTNGHLEGNWINGKNNDTLFKFKNKQKRVDIEGYVWEDIASNKNTSRDDLYIENSADKLIQGLTVYLKRNQTIIAVRKTNVNGMYFFPAKGTYNSNGTGGSYTIDIDSLKDYVVEFEYNGLRYENVLLNLYKTNGSKAKENEADRMSFNNNFYNIQNGETGTGIELTYETGDYKSKLVKNTLYTAESLSGWVNPTSAAKMLANTEDAIGKELNWSAGIKVIRNINFGIYERPQPDLAISTDIDNVKLTINGYEDTYYYNQRNNNINDLLPDDANYDTSSSFSVEFRKNTGYRAATYTRTIYDSYIAYTKSNESTEENKLKVYVTYKIVVKNESSKYAQVILENYADGRYIVSDSINSIAHVDNTSFSVTWNKTQESGEATIYSTDLGGRYIAPGNSIIMYLNFEVKRDGILDLLSKDETDPIRNVTEIKAYSSYNYNQGKYENYGGIDIDSQPDNVIYGVIDTYEDDTDAAPDFKLKKGISKTIEGTVFEDNPVGVEKDKLNTGKERRGNGIYENGENGVKDVGVTLRNSNGDIVRLYKTNGNGGIIEEDAVVFTNADGNFNLEGIVPGVYYVEYIYGQYDDEYIYGEIGNNNKKYSSMIISNGNEIEVSTQSYKSTIITEDNIKTILNKNLEELDQDFENRDYSNRKNALWYWYQNDDLTKYSSALDDYDKRLEINDKLDSIDYEIENDYLSGKMDDEYYVMNAKASFMDIAIEDLRGQVTQVESEEPESTTYEVSFGIVERPRQSVQIDKEINRVWIALANGQTLIEGDPREGNMDYVTYPEDGGKLTIEIDNEIIEGATLDVTYEIFITNNSEIDYNTEEYYKYGTNRTNLVKLAIGSIVDYVDEKLSLTHNIGNELEYYESGDVSVAGNKWYLITDTLSNSEIAGIPISNDVFDKIKTRKNIVVRNLGIELSPGENTEKITLSANKLLTDLYNNDQIFDNYVEILNLENSVGRFYGEIDSDTGVWKLDTPGNFNVFDAVNTSEADNNDYGRKGKRSARMQIIPPTGMETVIIYSSIGLICLSVLAGGIVLIKKKVLD